MIHPHLLLLGLTRSVPYCLGLGVQPQHRFWVALCCEAANRNCGILAATLLQALQFSHPVLRLGGNKILGVRTQSILYCIKRPSPHFSLRQLTGISLLATSPICQSRFLLTLDCLAAYPASVRLYCSLNRCLFHRSMRSVLCSSCSIFALNLVGTCLLPKLLRTARGSE